VPDAVAKPLEQPAASITATIPTRRLRTTALAYHEKALGIRQDGFTAGLEAVIAEQSAMRPSDRIEPNIEERVSDAFTLAFELRDEQRAAF